MPTALQAKGELEDVSFGVTREKRVQGQDVPPLETVTAAHSNRGTIGGCAGFGGGGGPY